MTILQETIGRQALIALSTQYGSVADALMEIIDNPFDYRRGRHLTIDIGISKSHDHISLTDHGGEGMNDESLADWINWGTGHAHKASDIGQWHVGGKLACIYLAESLEIVCRRAGEDRIWRFVDQHWGSRTELLSKAPDLVESGALHSNITARYPAAAGFTEIHLRGLKPHRYEIAIIESRLANTYRALLERKECDITLNHSPVAPMDIPEAPSHRDRAVSISNTRLTSGATVRGRLWIVDRDKFKPGRGTMVEAGVRTLFNGRLITSAEQFGHYLAGRGSLQRLMGEVEIGRIKPNATKNGWDTDSPQWAEVEEFMYAQMQPLVAFLNSLIEGRPVSRELKKRAEQVRRDVEEALRRLRTELTTPNGHLGGAEVAPGGRAPAAPRPTPHEASEAQRERGEVRNRTEPPEDAIGRLLRRVESGVPPIDFDDLGRTSRSQPRMTDAGPRIVINTAYPLYQQIGETEDYLVETVFLHLLAHDQESSLTPKEFAAKLDELMFIWEAVAR